MTQLHFTLDYDFFVGLFSESPQVAFGKLMEQILNQFMEAESTEQLRAKPHERNGERTDHRNGSRTRNLTLRIGKLQLNVPRHRKEPFHSCIFEYYQRNEAALLATMMEMVIQGVSTRKIAKVTEELCGVSFSKSTVSNLCKELDASVREFQTRKLSEQYPFVMLDAMYIKVRENHRVCSKGLFVALGINEDGHKEILGFDVYDGETKDNWKTFVTELKERGLSGTDLFISDAHSGITHAIQEVFPDVSWQRCQAHLRKNIQDKVPKKYQKAVGEALTELFNCKDMPQARRKKQELVEEYRDVAEGAMDCLEEGFDDSMAVMVLPEKYRIVLRTSNVLERENEELRRRENVIRIFPNKESAVRLMGAVLMDHHDNWMGRSRTLAMQEYHQRREELVAALPKLKQPAA